MAKEGIKVEIIFEDVTDIQQTTKMDKDLDLTSVVKFSSRTNPMAIARLLNLMRQMHGPIRASLQCDQAVMDFFLVEDGQGAVGMITPPPDIWKPAVIDIRGCVIKPILDDFTEELVEHRLEVSYTEGGVDGTGEILEWSVIDDSPRKAVIIALKGLNMIPGDSEDIVDIIDFVSNHYGTDNDSLRTLIAVIETDLADPFASASQLSQEPAEAPKKRRKAKAEVATASE